MICIARTCAQRGVLGFCIQDRVPAEHIERTARARSRAHARTRTFGAPLTVPAGSAARSASHTLSSGLSLPVTVGRGREVGGHVGVWMGGWEEGVGEWAAGPLVRASKLHHQSTAQPAPRARSTPERACAADVHDVTVPLHLHQSLHAHSAGRGHLPCAGVVVWASVCTCVCVCGGGASVCVCGGGEGCVVVRVGAWAATGPPAITVHVPHAHLTPPPPPSPTHPPTSPHTPRTHPAHVVATQVHKHHMLRTLLLIRQKILLQRKILLARRPPRARPRQRPAQGWWWCGGGGGMDGEGARRGQEGGARGEQAARRRPPEPPLTHRLVTSPSDPTRHRISGDDATTMQPRA